MREALKIAILFLGMALKSYILWCSRGYCAVPTFLRVFPVSAPCLSSSFKSIYCSQKSIRLSEERCRFWGYGSLLSHFLPLFLIHKKKNNKKKKVKAELPACPFFLVGDSEGGVSHIIGKEQGRAEPFPWTARSMEQVFHSLSQTHKKHFYARSNHIPPCRQPSLRQSTAYPQFHS